MTKVTVDKDLIDQALAHLINLQPKLANGLLNKRQLEFIDPYVDEAIKALRKALAEPAVEPVWVPIEQKYPQDKEIDILMADGSILCGVLPQSDGDLWWEGAGTGERFIDPKYANVTHWRVHCEVTPPPQAQQPAEVDYHGMYLKVRDELIDAQQRLDTCKALARSVMNDQAGIA